MYSLSNKDNANSRPIFQFIDFIGFFYIFVVEGFRCVNILDKKNVLMIILLM